MNLIEALTLAREKDIRVRPVCWRDTREPPRWIAYPIHPISCQKMLVVQVPTEGEPKPDRPYLRHYPLMLNQEEELLGDWEAEPVPEDKEKISKAIRQQWADELREGLKGIGSLNKAGRFPSAVEHQLRGLTEAVLFLLEEGHAPQP